MTCGRQSAGTSYEDNTGQFSTLKHRKTVRTYLFTPWYTSPWRALTTL